MIWARRACCRTSRRSTRPASTCWASSTTCSTSRRSRPAGWISTWRRSNLGQLVQDVVGIVRPMVEKNANVLTLTGMDQLGEMHADLTKVRQTLFNLLSNAAKFTEAGTIELGVARIEEQGSRDESVDENQGHSPLDPRSSPLVIFTVSDTGIGMDCRSAGPAVRGVHPGRSLHRAPLRRDRPGPGDQPPLLPADGRRHHR